MSVIPMELIAQVDSLAKHERLEISKRTTEDKPPYIVIGNGNTSKKFTQDVVMDALAVFATLSPKQQLIVLHLRDEMVRNQINAKHKKIQLPNPNEIYLSQITALDVAQQVKKLLSENGNNKALVDKKVMRKIKKNIYMLNPFMFIPAYKFAETAQLWHSLEKPVTAPVASQSEAE